MNLHVPQSVEAATELRMIAAVPLQIVSPRESVPIVSVVQDTLVGTNRFTRPNILFNKKEAMNLLVHAKRWNGVLPPPITMEPQPMWNGQQLLSALLPPVSLQMPNKSYDPERGDNESSQNMVKILNGQILQGVLDKDVFGKQLLHIIYNDFGPEMTVDFLDSLQAMIATYLMNSGFSVGISDLIADEKTVTDINVALQKIVKTVEDQILQLHMGLFENNSGRTNQEEFESKLMTTLNKANDEAGKIGLRSLADTNRMTNMIKAGSKGSNLNVSQMVATLGQQAIEGKRVPNGFQHRTLPHFKRFDDSAPARGFIASSYIKGLQPDEFFFHAMSGREGLIDTAVKSVTGETPIVILENNETKTVPIGDWIDAQLAARNAEVEHFEERDMELLQLEAPVYIPTTDADGKVSWGLISAITRHDPGKELYEIKTAAGKSVIVTESKSLLIYNDESKQFERMNTPDVRPGHYVPTTMNLATPPVITTTVSIAKYLPKTEYLYGTDFHIAHEAMTLAMADRERIPAGWWTEHNGSTFTLPYDSKAKLQRALTRSNIANITRGFVYPFTTNREHSRIPDTFELNYRNGLFMGLFLAEGNVDIKSGYVQITNNAPEIRTFVAEWFAENGIHCKENSKTNKLGGTTTDIRGYSTVLAELLTRWVGHGAANKRVPSEAFAAPTEFLTGLLNGYISGDGTVDENSVNVGSASAVLIDGISMICTRLGVFGKVSTTIMKSNNIGTADIQPVYRLAIRAQWATLFAEQVRLIDAVKEKRLRAMAPSKTHRAVTSQNDVILDRIEEIKIVDVAKYPKVYDLTVPSTLNFGLANGLHVVDTADTGYMQRQIRVALEDLITQHDGSVRDAGGSLVEIAYGEDGLNATKLENCPLMHTETRGSKALPLMSDEDIVAAFGGEDANYIEALKADRKMIVENVFGFKPQKSVRSAVHLERTLFAFVQSFGLKAETGTVGTPEVLACQAKILERTHPNNRVWAALVRIHLAPPRLRNLGFTPVALDAFAEQVVLKHWKAWVEPGQPVGVIAAQSIGEPATQMCSIYDTKVVIHNKDLHYNGPIGKYIDALIAKNADKVIVNGPDSVILDLDGGDAIVGVSTDEKTSWLPIKQVSRHPANGGLVEVHTRTGRITTATLTHSFLKRTPMGIAPILGSDLKVGDRVPVAKRIAQVAHPVTSFVQGTTKFELNREFGWLCGLYVADGCFRGAVVSISKVNPMVETKLKEFAEKRGMRFTTNTKQGAYGPSKDNDIHSKDLRDFLESHFSHGSFEKRVGDFVFHAPLEFIAGFVGGYFDGDGNVSIERQHIRLSSRNMTLMRDMNRLLGFFGMYGYLGKETSIRMPDAVQYTLNIAKAHIADYQREIGFVLPEKATALAEIANYKAHSDKPDRSQDMLDKIPECGELIAETGKLLALPGQSRTYGRWAKKESIGRDTLRSYIPRFKAALETVTDSAIAAKVQGNIALLESAAFSDVLWDEIVELKYHEDPHTFVYDFTVPGNDSFMVDDNILVHNTLNTFHLAGVASKSNMTRGVPRLKELLKATKNPKAVELNIPLRRDLRDKKEEARRVARELEFTLLQDLVTVARIYYDPRDSATLIAEDQDWLAYLGAYETAGRVENAGAAQPDPLAGGAAAAAAEPETNQQSPWLLRFELDRELMFAKNITMDDVAFILRSQFQTNLKTLYTDYNANRLVFRARLAEEGGNPIDDLNTLKALQNKVMSVTAVRGIPGLRAVNYQKITDLYEMKEDKYEAVDQYVLISDGSNYLDVLTHPDIDPDRLVSNNVHDMFANLGIEAARATLYKEITTLFAESGSSVNYRHVCVLLDKMCHKGRLMSIDRYGINKNDIGPLAKMSFEQTEDIALRAAQFGERDPVLGVSAKVMLGAPIRAGTAFSRIMLDEASMMRLAESTPEQHPRLPAGPQAYTDEEVDDLIYGEKDDDECAPSNLRMNVVIPTVEQLGSIPETDGLQEEVDIDIVE